MGSSGGHRRGSGLVGCGRGILQLNAEVGDVGVFDKDGGGLVGEGLHVLQKARLDWCGGGIVLREILGKCAGYRARYSELVGSSGDLREDEGSVTSYMSVEGEGVVGGIGEDESGRDDRPAVE